MKTRIYGAVCAALMAALVLLQAHPAQAQDTYDFEEGFLAITLSDLVDHGSDSITYTKTLPLERYGATLMVTTSYYEPDNYFETEFVTSGAPSFDGEGVGQRGPLWPYSSVWNLRRKEQVIYADGVGLDAMLRDLETKFNGNGGSVGFRSEGEFVRGNLRIYMSNR